MVTVHAKATVRPWTILDFTGMFLRFAGYLCQASPSVNSARHLVLLQFGIKSGAEPSWDESSIDVSWHRVFVLPSGSIEASIIPSQAKLSQAKSEPKGAGDGDGACDCDGVVNVISMTMPS